MKKKTNIIILISTIVILILIASLLVFANEGVVINEQPTSTNYSQGTKIYVHIGQSGGEKYQWQIATRGYNADRSKDLKNGENEDGAIFSGVNTDTLCIENCPISYNQYVVRCVITKGDTQVISNTATLIYQDTYDVCIAGVAIANGKYKYTRDSVYRVNEKSQDYNIELSNSILTLNNLSIKRPYYVSKLNIYAGIYSKRNINLNLVGKSSITIENVSNNKVYGMYVDGDMIVTGDGGITIETCDNTSCSIGIYSKSLETRDHANIYIKTGSISTFENQNLGSICIYCDNDIILNGGDVELYTSSSKTHSEGISCNNIEMKKGNVKIYSQKSSIKTNGNVGFTFSGGNAKLSGKYYALDLSSSVKYNDNLTEIKYGDSANPTELKPWSKFNGSLNTNFKYLEFSRYENALCKGGIIQNLSVPINGGIPSYDFTVENDFDGADIEDAYIEWYRSDGNYVWGDERIKKLTEDDIFVMGQYYYLLVYYKTNPGYEIYDNFDLRLNSNKFTKVNTYIDENKEYALVAFKLNAPIPGIGDKIRNIFITGLYSPIVGNPVWYPTLDVISDPSDSLDFDKSHWEYSDDGNEWNKISKDREKDTYFESNKVYKYVCEFTPVLGYEYSTDCKAYLNGHEMVKKDNTWEYVFGKASSNREDKISTFKVISIPRYLKEGAQPDYGVNNIGINIDNVVLVQEDWYELSGNKLTELSNTFENGKSYVRKLAIITDYPHYFDTKENHLLEDKVNGESVKDYSNYTYNNNNTKADYVIEWALDKIYLYVYYPYVGCVEEKIIDRITIETATYPMIGEKLAFGYSILESGIVCTSKDVWSLSVNGRDFITLDHNMTNTFEEGEIYKLEFDIKVEKGYYLNDSVLAFINGNLAEIETKDDFIHISYLYPKLVNTHTHSFTIQNPDKIYLAKAATCTSKAIYYYSCTCKEHNNETFEYGEPLAHTYSDKYISCLELGHRRICDICGSESEIIAHVPNIDKATTDSDKHCIYCLYVLEKKIDEPAIETTNVQTQATTSADYISTECIHEKSDNYGFDSEGHYEICKKCLNKISEKEKHIFTNNKCIICGYEQQQTQTKISPFIWFIGGFVLILCAAVVVIIVRSKKK